MQIELIERYLKQIVDELGSISHDELKAVVDIIYNAYINNNQVFIMGNGGSASTASHFACDLGKNTNIEGMTRFRVMSLNDNISLMTALSNDLGYDAVFEEQLKNLINPGDIVIAITASGNSPNILKAVVYAREKQATTIGIVGFGGGKLKEIANKSIVLKSKNYGQVESIHTIITHLITQYFIELFLSQNN